MMHKQTIRSDMRCRRRALSKTQQQRHAQAVAKNIRRSKLLHHHTYACYWANDGEVDLTLLFDILRTARKNLYLPVLKPANKALWFSRYRTACATQKNRFGIPEPTNRVRIPAWALDVIFLPLVAFDPQGNRLGMGGGFYDRTLAFLRSGDRRKPQLIGIAHECQKIDQLPHQPWDVPLHGVVTEQQFYAFSPSPLTKS